MKNTNLKGGTTKQNMAKDKTAKAKPAKATAPAKEKPAKVAKERKERKSAYKDYLIKVGYKLTDNKHDDLLAYYRLTNRNPAWSVAEAQAGIRVKPKKEKPAKVKKEKPAKVKKEKPAKVKKEKPAKAEPTKAEPETA